MVVIQKNPFNIKELQVRPKTEHPERVPKASQIWCLMPAVGRRHYIRVLSVRGKSRQTIFAQGASHRQPAEVRYIDVSKSGRPKHGTYKTSTGWTQTYYDRDDPGAIKLEADGPEWIMPSSWSLHDREAADVSTDTVGDSCPNESDRGQVEDPHGLPRDVGERDTGSPPARCLAPEPAALRGEAGSEGRSRDDSRGKGGVQKDWTDVTVSARLNPEPNTEPNTEEAIVMGSYGWKETEKKADDAAVGGGIFLKLEDDGDTALIVWLGEPYGRDVIWTGERYLDAESDDGVAYLDNNPKKKASFRASMNALVLKKGHKDDKELKVSEDGVQIFENGVNWFGDLCKIKDKYGLGVWAFELQRNGKARDPKTTYSMLPDTKIADIDGLKERVESAMKDSLNDLENPVANNNDDDDDDKKKGNGVSGTINDEQKTALVTDLKELGREVLDEFLTKFDVKQLKLLPASKVDEAIAFIAEKKGGNAAAEEEIDPFA